MEERGNGAHYTVEEKNTFDKPKMFFALAPPRPLCSMGSIVGAEEKGGERQKGAGERTIAADNKMKHTYPFIHQNNLYTDLILT